ncbi:MAG: type II toxin-antitoxin system RelB/DinJ family antitoxin [Duncaniella sp.]|nr:type II toxin-antitoxin system RelB/DinJ family antitoxin [Duncaniella sp.]
MQQANISIRVDKSLKEKFCDLCDEFGLTTTSAIQIFMKAVVRERKIPFEIKEKKSIENKIYMDNILSMRETAAQYGIQDLSLEEINAEIAAARK